MITTWFPKAHLHRIQRDSERHAAELDLDRGDFRDCDNRSPERLVVNYLRHECTDYDENQTVERHREACEAIAEAYPSLADECARQIKRRRDVEREAIALAEEYEEEQRECQRRRKEIADKSKTAIKSMAVGQKVQYKHNVRCVYEAEIVKIGRSKVTVKYEVKAGKDRIRTVAVHASLVAPIEATA